MAIENFRGHVAAIADDLLGNVFAELVRDRSAPDRVRREAARAVVVVPVLRGFAVVRIAVVRTLPYHAGLGKPVHFRANLSGTQPALVARDERLAAVFIHDVVAVEADVLVEDIAVVVVERHRPLGRPLVLERRARIGPVS